MRYRTEHPDFPVDDPMARALLALGFLDESWHNDTCPRFVDPLTCRTVWLENPDPALRESHDEARLCVWDDLAQRALYVGDDLPTAIAACGRTLED